MIDEMIATELMKAGSEPASAAPIAPSPEPVPVQVAQTAELDGQVSMPTSAAIVKLPGVAPIGVAPVSPDPTIKFCYWKGGLMAGSIVGIVLETERLPGSDELKLCKVVASDGDSVVLVKAREFRRFLLRQTDRALVFFDGLQANAVICQVFANSRGTPLEAIRRLSQHIVDLSSIVHAQLQPPQGSEIVSPQYPPLVESDEIVPYALEMLGADDVARAKLFFLQQEAQQRPDDILIQMAATAFAVSLGSGFIYIRLCKSDAAIASADEFIARIFYGFRQLIHNRAAYAE